MQTLHPVRHPSRADTGYLRHRIQPLPVSQVLRMSSPIGQRKIMITAQSIIHLGHETLRLQRGADCNGPRAGEVIRRRKRRAVRQPGSGDDHRGLAAWTAVCHPHHAAWRSLQLCDDDRLIGGGHGFEHSRILSTDGVETTK
jgi:hypothetical protein